jgi:hypothetical protein
MALKVSPKSAAAQSNAEPVRSLRQQEFFQERPEFLKGVCSSERWNPELRKKIRVWPPGRSHGGPQRREIRPELEHIRVSVANVVLGKSRPRKSFPLDKVNAGR